MYATGDNHFDERTFLWKLMFSGRRRPLLEAMVVFVG